MLRMRRLQRRRNEWPSCPQQSCVRRHDTTAQRLRGECMGSTSLPGRPQSGETAVAAAAGEIETGCGQLLGTTSTAPPHGNQRFRVGHHLMVIGISCHHPLRRAWLCQLYKLSACLALAWQRFRPVFPQWRLRLRFGKWFRRRRRLPVLLLVMLVEPVVSVLLVLLALLVLLLLLLMTTKSFWISWAMVLLLVPPAVSWQSARLKLCLTSSGPLARPLKTVSGAGLLLASVLELRPRGRQGRGRVAPSRDGTAGERAGPGVTAGRVERVGRVVTASHEAAASHEVTASHAAACKAAPATGHGGVTARTMMMSAEAAAAAAGAMIDQQGLTIDQSHEMIDERRACVAIDQSVRSDAGPMRNYDRPSRPLLARACDPCTSRHPGQRHTHTPSDAHSDAVMARPTCADSDMQVDSAAAAAAAVAAAAHWLACACVRSATLCLRRGSDSSCRTAAGAASPHWCLDRSPAKSFPLVVRSGGVGSPWPTQRSTRICTSTSIMIVEWSCTSCASRRSRKPIWNVAHSVQLCRQGRAISVCEAFPGGGGGRFWGLHEYGLCR